MRYKLHLEWTDEYADLEVAKEDLRQIWSEIEQMADGSLEVFDVMPLPHAALQKPFSVRLEQLQEGARTETTGGGGASGGSDAGRDMQPVHTDLTRGRRPSMPRQSPEQIAEAKHAIENDLDGGVSFTADVMGQEPGVTHPWDQGLWIFPIDDPRHEIEVEAKKSYERNLADPITSHYARGLKAGFTEASQKMLGP